MTTWCGRDDDGVEAAWRAASEADGRVLRIAGPERRREAIALAARAFAGTADAEPELSTDWALGAPLADRADARRAALFEFLMAVAVARHGPPHGLLLGTPGADGRLAGVLLMRRLERFGGGVGATLGDTLAGARVLLGGWAALPAAWTEPALAHVAEAFSAALAPAIEAMHRAHAPRAHWHVLVVAVRPDARRAGHARALLRAAARAADAEGLPSYLECCGERHAALYARHGFREVERRALLAPRGHEAALRGACAHPLVAMRREPGAGPATAARGPA